ncbi:hypothetical protein PN498_12745 [Oscillatoria sp. CS-180]|uniref:hypothetical protein n=1 Tax=Oscillatoria sp. CS-180 TaxID=3021720 RepID=UPI002330CC24|nr:hypothetical protein [Oscillatoria sp. CS-180]MDB9526860.1 hypothetical protein [Oscillatoria sp. CS-180]
MIKLVIGFNLVIALFGFYVAWRIWQMKRWLMSFTVVLTSWERNTHRVLNPERTPELILRGQQATAASRQKFAQLARQLQQLQQILAVALIGIRLFRARTQRQHSRIRNN